jgi:hypothetical protein
MGGRLEERTGQLTSSHLFPRFSSASPKSPASGIRTVRYRFRSLIGALRCQFGRRCAIRKRTRREKCESRKRKNQKERFPHNAPFPRKDLSIAIVLIVEPMFAGTPLLPHHLLRENGGEVPCAAKKVARAQIYLSKASPVIAAR